MSVVRASIAWATPQARVKAASCLWLDNDLTLPFARKYPYDAVAISKMSVSSPSHANNG